MTIPRPSQRLWWLAAASIAALAFFGIYRSGRLSSPPVVGDQQASVKNEFLPENEPDVGWPFIRGPGYDAHSAETNLADEWPPEGPPILWRRALGQGYSAFVAGSDRVYTQVQTLAGQSVLCLHADSGETIWEHWYDWPYDAAGVYPGPRATPTLYEDRVYFAGPNGLIGCLDAGTGDPVWSLNVLEKYGGRGVDFGYSCSPTVLEGRVLLPVGGRGASLVALSAKDGSLLWSSGDDSASYTPALPIELGGRKLVVGYLENALLCCDRESGDLVWRHSLSHGYDEHSAWPIYREPHLWISGPFRGGSTLLELSTNSPPKIVWSSGILSNDVMSSVLVGERLFGFDLREAQAKTHRTSRGVFRCVEWSSGLPAWTVGDEKQREPTADWIGHTSLLSADGKLILLNDVGEIMLARASPERFEQSGRATVLAGEIGWTPPILHRGRVYVRNHAQAVCIYVGRLELLDASLQSRAVPATELPPSSYADWTKVVLPVEPEYAFDVPHRQWVVEWFLWSLAMLATAWATASIAGLVCWRWLTLGLVRGLALAISAILGLLGTTVISLWREDFIFTWPLFLYAVFHAAVLLLPLSRRNLDRKKTRHSLFGAVALFASAAAYFWLCRRLSLLFEWAFLAGYVPALPFVLLDAWVSRTSWPVWVRILGAAAAMATGFAAFYWSGVALLWLRY